MSSTVDVVLNGDEGGEDGDNDDIGEDGYNDDGGRALRMARAAEEAVVVEGWVDKGELYRI